MYDIFVLSISLIVYHTEINLNLNIIYAAKLYFLHETCKFFHYKNFIVKNRAKINKKLIYLFDYI